MSEKRNLQRLDEESSKMYMKNLVLHTKDIIFHGPPGVGNECSFGRLRTRSDPFLSGGSLDHATVA